MEKEIYEITSKTCALLKEDNKRTKIVEKDKIFIIEKPILKIIKESCEYYGSSLEGRIKGSKRLLGMKYKLPIIIEGSSEIIFFPTASPFNDNCCWISINNIKDYKAIDNNVIIEFNGNNKEEFPITYESLENQMFRASKLLLIIKRRQKN